MIHLNPHFTKDVVGNNVVVLPKKEYEKIIEELELLEDIRSFETFKSNNEPLVNENVAMEMIQKSV